MSVLLALLIAPLVQEGAPSLRVEPLQVEIGQPVEVELELVHSAALRLDLDPKALLPDDSWILLEGPRVLRFALPGEQQRVSSRARWTVASLEPGERPFAPQALELGGEALRAAPALLTVRAALGPEEDAPRPSRGFRAAADFAGQQSLRLPLVLLLSLLVLGGLGWLLLARRRRRPLPAAPRATPRERLAALAGQREPAAARAAFFELTALLRGVADARLGRELGGLTDEEWLAATPDPLLPADARGALARLLSQAEGIKYGRGAPTVFALDQALSEGAALLEVLEAGPAGRALAEREAAA